MQKALQNTKKQWWKVSSLSFGKTRNSFSRNMLVKSVKEQLWFIHDCANRAHPFSIFDALIFPICLLYDVLLIFTYNVFFFPQENQTLNFVQNFETFNFLDLKIFNLLNLLLEISLQRINEFPLKDQPRLGTNYRIWYRQTRCTSNKIKMHPLLLTIQERRYYAPWTRITSWRRRKRTGRWTNVKRKRMKKSTRTNTRLKPNQKCNTRLRNSPRSPMTRWNTKNLPRIYLLTRKTLRPGTKIMWKIPRQVNMTPIIITMIMEIPINHDTRP